MRASLPILSLVAWGILSSKDLVCFRLRIGRELLIDLARVDQKRGLRNLKIFLKGVR